MKDALHRLLVFIRDTTYEDLGPETVAAAKRIVLDTVGVALAGSAFPWAADMVDLLVGWGGKPESTVWRFGCKLPSFESAFINSSMANALDFDDIHSEVGIHAGCVVVPTVFALCEGMKRCTGKDLLLAVVTGVEVASKFGKAILEPGKGWHLSSVCGAFAAAAAAGKLLGLDGVQLRNALAIAYSQTSGTFQALVEGSSVKRMQPGFAARSGILSAYLAEKGFTGPDGFLEGKYGFFNLYYGGVCDPTVLTRKPDDRYEVCNLGIKPYPCCRLAHTAIEAVFRLLEKRDFSMDEVERITVKGSQAMVDLCGKPYHITRSSDIDAQFSMQYIISSVISKRAVSLDQFSPNAVRDPEILKQTPKIETRISSEIQNRWGVIVEVAFKDGQMISERVNIPIGQGEKPLDWDVCIEKFRQCSKVGIEPIDPDRIEVFLRYSGELENVSDLRSLIALLGTDAIC